MRWCELVGNTLMLRPAAAPDLQDLAEIIALFPPGFMAAGRDAHDEAERDWLCVAGNPSRADGAILRP